MTDSTTAKSLQSCPTLCNPRLPRPWDSPGKNTGVGCHFLLQCMKVKSESEVAQSCPTLATPWTGAYQAPPSMGFSRQKYWSGVPLPSPMWKTLGHPHLYKWPKFILFYGWVIFHCICVPHLLYPFFFNWRIIALKSCVGFYHIATLTSHRYTYVPSILNPFPPPTPSHPLGCHRALGWAPCVTQQIPTYYLFSIW